jgi:long-chain fatty acid transport protein
MQTIFFQPTASYKITDMISVGAGLVIATGNVKFKNALPLQDQNGNDGYAELKGKASGVGFNVGVHFNPSENLQIGLSYRSQVDMKVKKGEATFNVPSSLSASFPDNEFESTVPLPKVISLGVGFKPMEHLTLTAEANFVGWKPYDTLRFDFAKNSPTMPDAKFPRQYKNTLAVRLGASYQASEKLQVMAGGAYDPTPVSDGFVSPDLPDADRWLITGGLTYKVTPKLTVLTALEYGASKKRDAEYTPANFNGRYQTKAVIPCIGVTYDF